MSIRVTWKALVGDKREGLKGADNKISAYIMARHAHRLGYKMGGDLRGLDAHQREVILDELRRDLDFTDLQENLWVRSLNGDTMNSHHPSGFIATQAAGVALDQYQIDAVRSLPAGGGVLALGCGLGKTATALAAAYTVGCGRLYIVAPLNAIGTWEKHRTEMEKMFAEVEIVSMDSLHKVAGLPYCEESVVIFDEVHLLGNITSKRTKLAHSLRKQFDYGLALTGTLLHGGIEKALSVQNLAVPGLSRFCNKWRCGDHFDVIVRQQVGDPTKPRTVTSLANPAVDREDEWAEYLSFGTKVLNSQSASVADAVDIPEQHKHEVFIDAQPYSTLSADELVVRAVQELEQVDGEFPSMSKTMHFIARMGAWAKADWVRGEMADNDLPIVIFCAYTASMDTVEMMLEANDISYVRIDGSVTGADRVARVKEFNDGDVRVFLGQVEASCTSIDLTRAYLSVTVDHSWKAATYDQSLARTCRRGQTHECHHFDLYANAHQGHIIKRLKKNASFDSKVAWYQQANAVRQQLTHTPTNS